MLLKVLVFAGTTEGREISVYLAEKGIAVTACVATEYGNEVIPADEKIEVRTGRLGMVQMAELMGEHELVIDATHPYACIVTENIRQACDEAGREYIRLLRPSIKAERVVTVKDTAAAADYLNTVEGNVLLTTGSKELFAFTRVRDFEKRLFARVLPSASVVAACNEMGFKGSSLICMQGPFSHELNAAMLKQVSAKYLVTKDTGDAGGFDEKISAANEAGAAVVLIARPSSEEGVTLPQAKEKLAARLGFAMERTNSHFPLFIDIKDKRVLVVGAGKIAGRRIQTLLKFGAQITAVAPDFTEELRQLCRKGIMDCRVGCFEPQDMDGAMLVLAAADSRAVNHSVFLEAQRRKIPVNVADCKEECSFYFPAVFETDEVVGGLISQNGSSHSTVRRAAEKIRGLFK